MNIMRKLRGGSTIGVGGGMGTSGGGTAGSVDDCMAGGGNPQHTALGLMHLKKLFSEYTHPQHPLSDSERDDKLYNMLPLFCKVFGSSPSTDMSEKFWDILAFTQQVSNLMVAEIRKRASNQSTETASCAIVKFLEIENSEESSNGWMLLSTLNLLAAGDTSLIQAMTTASVPSTLVKCLYLFFDLPEMNDAEADITDVNSEFTPRERRILLQKIFVQLLVRLCSHPYPAEELARKDDLTLLFSAITSWCPQYNVMWRKSAAEVLMTISRHGLTQNVVAYIHNKGCIALCIDNMQRVPELAPLEVVEMFVTVFCFLKDSSEVSQMLLDDFRACQGYIFLSEFLLKHAPSRLSANNKQPQQQQQQQEPAKVEGEEEAQDAIRNLVLMLASLTMCGHTELKPSQASMGSLFQMLGFTLPQPSNRGGSVRNIQAFQVLQSVFVKSNSLLLCCTILDAISSVYHSDNANYFILEGQNTLSQFAEKIHLKNPEIQQKFFQLLEFIVFQLNFVPCKELISLSILLKSNHSVSCSIMGMETLLNILRHNVIFKDVYREVGMLEVFVTCLHRYATLLKDKQSAIDQGLDYKMCPQQERLGALVMEALTTLLAGNVQNANVFRECTGARCAHNLVPYIDCRFQALGIVRELILSAGGDDDMATLLGIMHSASPNALILKTHILKTLLTCLRESHRTRTVFRKVGGFVYVMSVLVSLESQLSGSPPLQMADATPNNDECRTNQSPQDESQLLTLLHVVFHTISTAMRFEPANAKFFHEEICQSSLCDTLRLLGCFSSQITLTDADTNDNSYNNIDNNSHNNSNSSTDNINNEHSNNNIVTSVPSTNYHNTLQSLFNGSVLEPSISNETMPKRLAYACIILRLLYDVALDAFDRPNFTAVGQLTRSPIIGVKKQSSLEHQKSMLESSPSSSGMMGKRAVLNSLNLNTAASAPEPIIVHPGIVVAMLHLLPSISEPSKPDYALALQIYIAEVIKSLVRSERNQQVMCDAGMAGELLSIGRIALQDETHQLHQPLQYIIERLAAQLLEPKDLRQFLRLGDPLCCISLDDIDLNNKTPSKKMPLRGGPVPLTRIKTLVSMTTPKDFRAHGSCTLPPFVELDMSAEGFACLYLPSIAPQSTTPPTVVAADNSVLGGIGSGDRFFPPQTGLTYSTWICIDKFSDPRADPHCVRLLTLVRNPSSSLSSSSSSSSTSTPGTRDIICFTAVLSARDKAIIVSTQETPMPISSMPMPTQSQCNVGEWEPEGIGENGARVWCPDLLHEGQWHHIAIVLNRAVLKNSSFSLYLDGQHIHSQKLHYISQTPGGYSGIGVSVVGVGGGGGAVNLTTTLPQVYGYIGTPPCWRRYSKLSWKQGPCHLVEEVFNSQNILTLFKLGPHYMGSMQAPQFVGNEPLSSLLGEEKVVFGLNSKAMSQLTLAKIRKVYSRADTKSIAKQLGMSSHENATSIRVLHNSAGHLSGPARALGGVVVGYLGVRVFNPRPVATTIDNVGGCSVLLGLIAMAQDIESLYAAVKALVCVVRSNQAAQQEMDRRRGYQTLAMLLRRKCPLLNSHILHLTFSLVGTVDSGRETSAIPNVTAFSDLLCDLQVWHEAPGELLRSLLEHLYELVAESNEKRTNLRLMRDLQLVQKLMHILSEVRQNSTRQVLMALLGILLGGQPRQPDLLWFGQFIVATLPLISEPKHLVLMEKNHEDSKDGSCSEGECILLRNRCLQLLHGLLFNGNKINVMMCDELAKTLGLDWILLFLQPGLHNSTVIWGLRILVAVCSVSTILQKFKEGTSNGGWIRHTEHHNKMAMALAGCQQQSLTSTGENKPTGLHVPGFQHLGWLLPRHVDLGPELYFLFIALMMGQPIKLLPADSKLELDNVWNFMFGVPANHSLSSFAGKINICPEAVVTLLAMVRTMLSNPIQSHVNNPDSLPEWLNDYPVTIIQFLFFLYHNYTDFMQQVFMSADVLGALAGTLFPGGSGSVKALSFEGSQDSSGASSPVLDDQDQNQPVLVRSPSKDIGLINHPARKFVMDFLRVIVVDSLSLSVTAKSPPVIDLILDAWPEHASTSQQTCYQTEVLSILMDHLLAADVLIGEQAALPVTVPGGSVNNITNNVCYVTARIVDKLWQGVLTKDPHEVFDFIIKLIGQAKRRPGASVINMEGLYHSLNRTILFLLSRSTDSIADQMAVLEALHKLTTHRLLVFGAGNHELEFISCLTYCLFQLTADIKIMLDTNIKTTWHVNPSVDLSSRSDYDQLTSHQGHNLTAVAATRVWEELYVCKKPAIEEVFKITLPAPGPGNERAPDLATVRDLVHEQATRLWLNYVVLERKASYRGVGSWELHNHIQSKIQKVTGGLTRLASRTKVRKEDSIKQPRLRLHYSAVAQWTEQHVGLVRELVATRKLQYQQTYQHTQRYVYQEWLQTETELTRERGLWGPPTPTILDKWMLDMTEGPCRMRKKMMKNDLFYIHYPYRPELDHPDNKQLKYKVATSLDSKDYYLKQVVSGNWNSGMFERERDLIIDGDANNTFTSMNNDGSQEHQNDPSEVMPCSTSTSASTAHTTLERHVSEPDENSEDMMNEQEEENNNNQTAAGIPDNQTLLRLLEENEKISHMFRCARIQGLDTTEGLLLFGKEHFYVIDGFTLLKLREIRDIESLPERSYEPILPSPGHSSSTSSSTSSSPRPRSRAMRQCSKFNYEDIREVHKRRYLLQPMALEVFSADGRNYLLAFPRKVRNKVYQRFMTFATAIADSAHQSVAGQKRTANVEQATGLLSNLIGETSVTQRWVRGEISNFQYLMHLNTLAGRSYNDLMQYPIFPWILADYESEELDFNHSITFRDFTKPMGAQSSERLLQFKKRYKEWDDPHGETPPYHYGTHYSSAMIVCSYLVRMEPFTQHFLRLQGGHFDLADRMFNSIKEAWLSASKHNMADVKELIPEFFYLPEFLMNSNHFDLGSKQSGVQLGDVVLPPWAKQDPREFIRMHRLALECDFVSQNLHHWIDLIFGYKQNGPAAVDAVNVFHHLFYEGNVDIYNIDDPLKKNATIGFINNFGQIPKQLFKKPHPCKKMTQRTSVIDPGPITPGLSITVSDRLFFHNLDNLKPSLQPIKELKGQVGQILHIDKSALAVEQNKTLIPPSYNKYVAWGFADHSLRIGNYDSDKAIFVCEASMIQCSGQIVACVCPSSKLIVTAGTNSVVTVWEYSKRQLSIKQCLYGHTEAVTCLSSSPAYNVIVSGSRDSTAIIWDLSRCLFVRQLQGHAGPVAAVAINDLTGDIATCAATWLHVWSINGEELARVNTCVGRADRMQQILCVAFSQTHEWDSQNVIMTGSTDGVARMWSMDYVQVPVDVEEEGKTEINSDKISTVTATDKSEDRDLPSTSSISVEEERTASTKKRVHELVKQMSINVEESSVISEINKSGSESSLSEVENASKEARMLEEKEECSSDNESSNGSTKVSSSLKISHASQSSAAVILRRKSRGNPMFRKSEGGGRADSDSTQNQSSCESPRNTPPTSDSLDIAGALRTSKSDTSLTDSFVMIENDVSSPRTKKINPQNILRDGFKWQRQLVFRSKLTMHTAYDRKDNAEPASITALAVSKDHRTVYVGDARGRVFSWSVCEQPGRTVADHWLKDEGADTCVGCGVRFNLYERRHHCRNCGQVFCSKCSKFESKISRLGILKPVRVCQGCYSQLRSQGSTESNNT